MAEFSKLKRNALGAPPPIEEASPNLQAPEIAPNPPAPEQQPSDTVTRERRDGRTLRKTNRTLAFATRVSPEFDNRLRDVAERDGLKLVEVLEKALDAYEHARKKR